MTDPFSAPETEFLTAKAFTKAFGEFDRLAIVTPTAVEVGIESTMPNAKDGDTYDRVIADVVILDGPVTERIDAVPCRFDGMILSGSALVPQLTKRIGGGNIAPGKMVLGRFTTRKGKYPTPAVVLAEFTPEDAAKARAYLSSLDPFAA